MKYTKKTPPNYVSIDIPGTPFTITYLISVIYKKYDCVYTKYYNSNKKAIKDMKKRTSKGWVIIGFE